MKSGALVSPPNIYPPCWKPWPVTGHIATAENRKKLCFSYFVEKTLRLMTYLPIPKADWAVIPTAEVELQTENFDRLVRSSKTFAHQQAAVAAQFPAKFKPRLAWLSPRAQSADLLVILLGFRGLENCSYSFFMDNSFFHTFIPICIHKYA